MNLESLLFGLVVATCLLHWGTVYLLVRRIQATEQSLVWKLLCFATGLLAIHQFYLVMAQFIEVNPPTLSGVSVGLNLLVAGLLFGGIVESKSFLHLLQRNKELLAVIDERNESICQFHEGMGRALHRLQLAMAVGNSANLSDQIEDLLNTHHAFVEALKDNVLLGNNFEVALKTLVDDVTGNSLVPFRVQFDQSCEEKISREQGTELLHILREAIRNSVQYSQAKKGLVSVKMMASDLVLEVSDNGVGFEVDLVRAQGRGLGQMVNRAQKIGARLKIQSQPYKGTSVLLEVPSHGKPGEISQIYSPSKAGQKVLVS
jgi:two-component sensor histidine kinase